MWKFTPIYKTTIWGGGKIARLHNFVSDEKIGESWLLSGLDGSVSVVADGPDKGKSIHELIVENGDALLGKLNFQKYGETFPLLIKIIDAADKLSVQVHPDDETARRLGLQRGKTEMWYALPSDEHASLTLGFNRDLDPQEFTDLVAKGEITSALNKCPVREGDVFLIPAGTVHAIDSGCFLIEIQQTSDDTFRIYDYGRTDAAGNPRQLHLDHALESLCLSRNEGAPIRYTAHPDIPINVVKSPFFTTNVMTLDEPIVRDYSECDSFVAVIATRGSARISSVNGECVITPGELVLIPASTDNITIEPTENFRAIETYIKQ